jgi:predicted transcriptional regulator
METTTIQIRKTLKKRLDRLKVYPNEPMDSVIERLTHIAVDEEPLSAEDIRGIEEGLADIKAGRVYTTEQLKKKLGIK